MIVEKTERSSGIELLKILAVIMIVFSHAMPVDRGTISGDLPEYIMQLNIATQSLQRFVIVLFKYGGQVGNAIFIICSAWFLIESNKVSVRKIFYMVADSFLVSIIGLLIFMALGCEIPIPIIIKQFFPITMDANWFIGCYLLFYTIHPALNSVIERMDQRALLIMDLIIICLFCCIQGLLPGKFYYSDLIGFVSIYFIVAYVKKYLNGIFCLNKINILILVFSSVMLIVLIAVTNCIGLKIALFFNQVDRWRQYVNPLIILIALSLFQMARRKIFVSRRINYIAGMSMLIFIIHHNYFLMTVLQPGVFQLIYEKYSYQYELLWVVISALVLLLGAMILSIFYKKFIGGVVIRSCDWLYEKMRPMCNKLLEMILKLE